MTQHLGAGIKPIGFDRNGEKWAIDDVRKCIVGDVLSGTHLILRAKNMQSDLEKATEIVEAGTKVFDRAHHKLMEAQARVSQSSKVASGQVREASTKLAEGLQRIEKTANFDKLERYVVLLERAASAMESLAALEKAGKLEKIMQAVK